MLAALAFVPVNNVIQAYEATVSTDFWLDNDENDANIQKQTFLNYFEKNYIGVMDWTQKKNALPNRSLEYVRSNDFRYF
jgi:hypothetical protein